MDKILRDKKAIFVFIAPALIMFLLVLIIPTIQMVYYSLCDYAALTPPEFVGLKNYKKLFFGDATFRIALKNSIFFMIFSAVTQQIFGLLLAVMLTNIPKGRNIFKNIYYLPCVLSSAALGLLWSFLFNPRIGINNLLAKFGIEGPLWLMDSTGFIVLPMWDQNLLETRLDRLITEKMTQILNAMLDAEADEITGAARYERSGGRKAYRAGHYERKLTAKAGRLELKVPKLKGALFESAVIERYRRREQSVEESLIDMYLAGVSTRQVDDISQLLWGDRMPSQTLSDKLKRIYGEIDQWRTRPLESEYPYVFVDGVWHKRSWGGHVENVSVLVAIGINAEGHREVIGVTEGMREDSASWEQFFRGMIERGLKGVRLVVGDRCAGLVATVGSMLPKAKYQRCMVHFMRNVLSKVPPIHREWASAALKAVFAMESRESALDKAEQVAAEMRSRRLRAAANCLREGVGETTTYLLDEFPDGHRRRIRTNNMIERLNREIRRRTRVVGGFPDGNSALMLVCARIRYVTANEWSTRRYLDMSRFDDNLVEAN